MSAVRSAHSSSVTVTEVEATTSPSNATSIEQLFVRLDAANRTEISLVSNTIIELLQLAARDPTRDPRSEMKKVILVAFKRRNHQKSQAEGEGPGEKAIFIEILLVLIQIGEYDDLIEAVLPLVPLYGYWRDLRKLSEQILLRLSPPPQPTHPLVERICALFARQLQEDAEKEGEGVPSNACKYVPHEGRHRGGGNKKRKREGEKGEMEVEDVEGEKGEEEKGEEEKKLVRPNKKDREVNKVLAAEVARCLGKDARGFRRMRSSLNTRLRAAGHLVEPLLCERKVAEIDFARANKGALQRYSKRIKGEPEAARKWEEAMKKGGKAVPDIDSLLLAVQTALEEGEAGEGALRIFPFQFKKALETLRKNQGALVGGAKTLLSSLSLPAEEMEEKLSLLALPVHVVVDTAQCFEREQRGALVLGGLLLALSQRLSFFVLDGERLEIEGVGPESWLSLLPLHPAPIGGESVERFRRGLGVALRREGEVEGRERDVIFLCHSFPAYEENKEEVEKIIKDAQENSSALSSSFTLRALRVHRLRPALTGGGEGAVAFQPRQRANPLPLPPSADLCLVVDCTGSMGSYMEAVKGELLSLLSELRISTSLRQIRVSFVAYRDYQDAGRVVAVDFQEGAGDGAEGGLGSLMETIRAQEPSGGGDTAEDLLSALVAAASLSWASPIRIMVIITDADAHGTNPRTSDYYKGGRCPDQAPPYPSLSEITSRLATEREVDMFFCQLNDQTVPTLRALAQVYGETLGGRGFGTISLQQQGVQSFRAQVLGSLTQAILGGMTSGEAEGLHTSDGVSLSSLSYALLASGRETLSLLGLEGGEEGKKGERDWDRLWREMGVEDFAPLRIALGLAGWEEDGVSLSEKVAEVLYRGDVTVEMVREKGYPEDTVKTYQDYLSKKLKKV